MVEMARSQRRHRRAGAASAVAATVVLWALGLAVGAASGHAAEAVGGLGAIAFAVVGALVVWQRPGNPLGGLFCVGGVLLTVLGTGGAYGRYTAAHPSSALPAGLFVSWLADLAALPSVALLAGVVPQLFPNGRPLSRRWRPALWAAWTFMVLATVGNAFMPQKLESVPGRDNPYAVASWRGVWSAMIAVTAPLGIVALVASLVTLCCDGDVRAGTSASS
jgi:hypothetical protein